ncbi:MAG: hypothetical protein ACI8UO_006490 [Verrucomicrobiales bacterium]|jgi:hypothetical protein
MKEYDIADGSHHPQTTVAPVVIPTPDELSNNSGPRPEWIRLPKSGTRCPYTGLTRASLNSLILPSGAVVESVVLRQKGATRGVRLIRYGSLLAYLNEEAKKRPASRTMSNHLVKPSLRAFEFRIEPEAKSGYSLLPPSA